MSRRLTVFTGKALCSRKLREVTGLPSVCRFFIRSLYSSSSSFTPMLPRRESTLVALIVPPCERHRHMSKIEGPKCFKIITFYALLFFFSRRTKTHSSTNSNSNKGNPQRACTHSERTRSHALIVRAAVEVAGFVIFFHLCFCQFTSCFLKLQIVPINGQMPRINQSLLFPLLTFQMKSTSFPFALSPTLTRLCNIFLRQSEST